MNKPPGAQAAAAAAPAAQNTTEYTVRVPKASRRKFNMMRFHQALGVDFKQWSMAKMERENNQKEFRSLDDEMPKFGAGSEYGRDQREEARRKKYGINMRKYISENQPWLLTVGGKNEKKKFKGIREGGVSENSSWYVFMQGKDGAFEAFPVEEWYNFKMIQRYNTLTAEEAEEQFEKRDKIMNFHALRWEKKLKQDVEDPDEEESKKGKKTKSTKSLLISELDDWMSSGDSGDGDAEDEDGESKPKKAKAKGFKKTSSKRTQKGGRKKRNDEGDSDDDCFEESDEYDEMAEHEYISSDSSDSACEDDELVRKELAGVAEDDALKKMLNSDSSTEDEEKKKEKEKEDKKDKENEDNEKEGEEKEKEKKKKKKKKKETKKEKDSDGNSSSDDEKQNKKKKKPGDGDKDEGGKRKMKNQAGDGALNKKLKPDAANGEGASGSGAASAIPPPGSESGVTEEAIRRYLMRKPMTTIELLQKFKNKKTGLSSDQLVRAIAAILKKINPIKQMVKGKMYLSIKT